MARLFRCLMSTDKNAVYVSSFTKLFRRSCHERSCLNPTDGLSTDDKEIYEHALSFAKNEMAPYMKEWDLNQTFPRDTLQHAAQLGFGAICCQDTYGGSNLGRLQASIIFEALAQGCPSTTAYLSIHNMCAWMIDTFGNEDLRKKWMPNLAKMENFASYCLTEPDSGSDSASLKTSIVKKSNEYVINGTKWKLHKVMSCKDGGFIRDDGNKGGSMQLSFISGAGESSVYLVMGRTGCEGPKGISCVLVEADRKGLSYGKKEEKVGWCTHPARQVFLEDVVVPTSNLLGKENKGFHIAMDGLNGGRVNIASVSLGAATAALDAVKEHLGVRKQFGKSLKEFQYLQFKFAEMATSVVASRLMVRHAAKSLESKSPNYVPLASMAKLFVTEQCSKVCDDAIQMFGGYGYLKEYPVQQYYRDARLHHIIEGTNEMMRLLISRNVLSS